MYQSVDENVTKRFARTLSYLSTRSNSSAAAAESLQSCPTLCNPIFANLSLTVTVYNMCVCISCSVISSSWRLHGLQPTKLLCPWNSPGKNMGVGCHSLLQGIFLTPVLNLGLLHCRQILYHLSLQGSLVYNTTIANKKRLYLIKSAAYKGLLRGTLYVFEQKQGYKFRRGKKMQSKLCCCFQGLYLMVV